MKRYMETKEGKYYTEYCRDRNQVRNLTRRIQKEFEMNLATEAKTNPKAVWKYMNSKTKNPEGISDLNTDPKGKGRCLKNFFFKCFYYRARWCMISLIYHQ